MSLAPVIEKVLGNELPVAVDAYDGSHVGDRDAETHLVIKSPDALQRIVTSPGELGMARAYVAGELDIEGSIWDLLALRDRMPDMKLDRDVVGDSCRGWAASGTCAGRPPPPEEVAPARPAAQQGAATPRRSATTTTSRTSFYRIVLGPSMTYSCAVFARPDGDAGAGPGQQVRAHLPQARPAARHAPARRRLRLGRHGPARRPAPRRRGGRRHHLPAPGRAGREAGRRGRPVADRVEIRLQDYRDVDDGPFDAVSSIGMFEHVGEARLGEYFAHLRDARRARAAACSTTASAAPAARRTRLPPAQLRRPLRVPRRRAARGRQGRLARPGGRVRGAPRRGPARALRPHAAPLGRQPRGQLGRRRRRGRARAAPASGACTWPAPRSTSRPGARRSTRCSAWPTTTPATPGMPLRPIFE